MNLAGKVCVVTGATEGIGRAVALALGERGARVAVCARTAERVEALVAELGTRDVRAMGLPCDVSQEADVHALAHAVRSELGPADVVVNNAGIASFGPVHEMPVETFDRIFAVNVRGVFLMTRAFLPDFLARGRGDIVNVASLAGRNGVENGAAYSASKHAVLGLSRSMMLELRRQNVRVITVCPGTVVTRLFDKSSWPIQHPDRKLAPEDVAHVVVAALEAEGRAMVSELDIRPTNP